MANRLFALLVDGGESGGQTYTGVGFTKAWHIHVHALYNYHTEISTFAQHGSYLAASCADLTGIDLPSLLDGSPSGEVIGVAGSFCLRGAGVWELKGGGVSLSGDVFFL